MLTAFGPPYAWRHLRTGRKLAPRGAQDVAQVRRMTNFHRQAYCRPVLEKGGTQGFFKLAVVRHPEDRVVSGFVDKTCGEDREAPWVRAVREAGGTGGDITFESFLAYLNERATPATPTGAARATSWRGTPSTPSCASNGWRRTSTLSLCGWVPRISASSPAACKATATTPRPPPSPPTSRGEARARSWDGARPMAPSPKAAFLTPETRARIRRVYARDFALLP